ncbi:MAG TPA: M17 family peptidase N-terminal domain-containing protein, partial [Sphingomicrobium sp.]|nr:M17 family peptidase N-terminal domain-containing protein [Sphingomicrobium sp.]
MAKGAADPGGAGNEGGAHPSPNNGHEAPEREREPYADRVTINFGSERRLELTLAKGDITQIDAGCYVVGLFKAVAADGAVSALDRAMDGQISDLIARRMFGAEAGEVSVLPNLRRSLRAPNVAFVGLGSFDSFNTDTLKLACDNLVRTFVAAGLDDFAMVPFGWSSVGSTSDDEAKADLVRAMLSGFVRAIEDSDVDHEFRGITIAERDPERFALINDTVHDLALRESFEDLELTIRVVTLPEPPAQRGASTAKATPRVYLMAREAAQQGDSDDGPAPLQMSVLTTGAKAGIMVELQPGSPQDLENLLDRLDGYSTLPEADAEKFGDDLAKVLLPDGICAALKQYDECHLVVVHDAAASRIPWETLRIAGKFPPLIGGMSHRYETPNLSVAKWLQSRQQSEILSVLLVTNPTKNLPGAEAEGDRILELLKNRDRVRLTELRGDAATKD